MPLETEYTTVHIGNQMIDIGSPTDEVEVQIREDGKVIWVNVDGICRLRMSRIPTDKLKLNDLRIVTQHE